MFVPDLVEQASFLAQVAEMEAKHQLEMEQLMLKNGRECASRYFNVIHDDKKLFDSLDDFKCFVRDIYDTMVEDQHAGYRDTRIVIPGTSGISMSADFYCDEQSDRDEFAKDLIVVRIRVDDAWGRTKKYEIYRYRENDAPSVEAAFTEVFIKLETSFKQI